VKFFLTDDRLAMLLMEGLVQAFQGIRVYPLGLHRPWERTVRFRIVQEYAYRMRYQMIWLWA
jgi:hypothetical protein